MTKLKGVNYSVKCFNYHVQFIGVGTHSDSPAYFFPPELEGVICIARDYIDVEKIFQGYLCYPEDYHEFYKSGDFILCYGPKKDLDFEAVLDSEVDVNKHRFHGLDETQIANIKKTKVK